MRSVDATVETVRVGNSNQVVQEVLDGRGEGRVLLVDGGGVHARFALVGDRVAALAIERGWAAVVVDGLVRDSDELAGMPIGVWARGTTPRRGRPEGPGVCGIDLLVGGSWVRPGARLAADGDGIVVVE